METTESARAKAGLPGAAELRATVLDVARRMPQPVARRDAVEAVAEYLGLSAEQRAVPGPGNARFYYQFAIGWTLNDLKWVDAFDQPRRGLYRLTDEGRTMTLETVEERHAARRGPKDGLPSGPDSPPEPWSIQLLERLKSMSPTAFEHLAKVLLTSAGFDDVQVTGGSGDGGIDGIGMYRPSGFITFHTAFQCKRYQGSVGASAVRDFRGSFIGRSDRGIFITTGSFTRDARDEAARPGANPVDLIDGEALCDLLKEHKLGVKVTLRTVEDVVIDEGYFGQFEDAP